MQKNLDSLIQHIPQTVLKQAAMDISARYRNQDAPYLRHKFDYLAYAITRMPATLAAMKQVLKNIPNPNIQSLLDLGAGPGTSFFAASEFFPQLSTITLLETDPAFIALGEKLVGSDAIWKQAELPCALTPHDLVLMSYSLNEIAALEETITIAFQAATQFLVIIEPGTPEGYARIIQARTLLLNLGAHMIAPCPNALPCPLQGHDWCHFPARVARTKLHKQLKGGDLGYEDEKFSYLIVAKQAYALPTARIIAPPQIHKGHVVLPLCENGLTKLQTISQKNKALYKICRKSDWGDCISE